MLWRAAESSAGGRAIVATGTWAAGMILCKQLNQCTEFIAHVSLGGNHSGKPPASHSGTGGWIDIGHGFTKIESKHQFH